MKLPRWVHRLYAFVAGYFWVPCPACGKPFGGHEWVKGADSYPYDSIPTGRTGIRQGVCPDCSAWRKHHLSLATAHWDGRGRPLPGGRELRA